MTYEAQILTRPRGDSDHYRAVVWLNADEGRLFVALTPYDHPTRAAAINAALVIARRHNENPWKPWGKPNGAPVPLTWANADGTVTDAGD